MEFKILSRSKAKQFSYKFIPQSYVIISITDVDAQNVAFMRSDNLKDVLRLRFDDTEEDTLSAIMPRDAAKIVDFVLAWKDKADMIVVHCEMGVSRSAGVAAALMLWLNGSNDDVFGDINYSPNMRCYNTVLQILEERKLV